MRVAAGLAVPGQRLPGRQQQLDDAPSKQADVLLSLPLWPACCCARQVPTHPDTLHRRQSQPPAAADMQLCTSGPPRSLHHSPDSHTSWCPCCPCLQFLHKLAPPTAPYLHNDLHYREAPPNWPGGWEAW